MIFGDNISIFINKVMVIVSLYMAITKNLEVV